MAGTARIVIGALIVLLGLAFILSIFGFLLGLLLLLAGLILIGSGSGARNQQRRVDFLYEERMRAAASGYPPPGAPPVGGFGAPARYCPVCGQANAREAQFCQRCGRALPPPPA